MAKALKFEVSFKQTKKDIALYSYLLSLDDRGCWIKEKLYAAMQIEIKENN